MQCVNGSFDRSIREFLGCSRQSLLCSLGVPRGRIQGLMAKNLSQPDEVVLVVFEVPVSHRVP